MAYNYENDINSALQQLAGYGQYTPRYDAQIADTQNKIANYGPYKSRYEGNIQRTLEGIHNTLPYMSAWEGKLNDTLGKIEDHGSYASQYADRIAAALDNVTNWNYDPENDRSYKAYEQLYTNRGKRAMQDTLGQVAARTGGLASSYAAGAAQQSYNNYMQELAAMMPTLEANAYNRAATGLSALQGADQTAYERWRNELSDLTDLYGLYQGRDATDYGRYLDDIQARRNLLNDYLNIDQTEYGRWQDSLNNLYNQVNMYEGSENNKLGQWQAGYGYLQDVANAYNQAQSNYYTEQQLAEEARQFDASLAMQQAELAERARQYDSNLAWQQSQAAAAAAAEQLAQQQAQQVTGGKALLGNIAQIALARGGNQMANELDPRTTSDAGYASVYNAAKNLVQSGNGSQVEDYLKNRYAMGRLTQDQYSTLSNAFR